MLLAVTVGTEQVAFVEFPLELLSQLDSFLCRDLQFLLLWVAVVELKRIDTLVVATGTALAAFVPNTRELEATSVLPLDVPVAVLAPAVQTTTTSAVEELVLAHTVALAAPLVGGCVVPKVPTIVLPERGADQAILSCVEVADLPLNELSLGEGPTTLLTPLGLLRHMCSLTAYWGLSSR